MLTRRYPGKGTLIGVLLTALVLAACAAASQPAGAAFDKAAQPPAPADATGGNPKQVNDLAARKIVKTGEVSIQVPNVANALARVRAMALALGGYVGGSQSGTLDESATLTLRIPAARFDDALARLHELDGKVLGEATREEDVTSAVVDLEARLRNLQASETQYRALLAQAVKVEDILAVQTRLDEVRGQIEQFQAQDKELTGMADLATLTVTLMPGAVQHAAGSWDPGKTVQDALAALVSFGQWIGSAAIWLAIVGLPALISLAILIWLLSRLVPGIRTRIGRTPKT